MSGEALVRFTTALDNYGSWTNGRTAQCPAHEDSTASLSIGKRRDGQGIVIKCHANCDWRDILASLGLTDGDLYDEPRGGRQLAPAPRRVKTAGTPKRKPKPQARGRVVDQYPYTDERGTELFRVIRFDPKGFAQGRMEGGRIVYGLPAGVRLVPYRLPRVIAAAAAGRRVWIVGGEKDVASIEAQGETATTNPGGEGTGKWLPEWAGYFDGADVVIVADRDLTGYAHAREVAKSLKGHARNLWIVEAAEGKDATDHISAGYTLGQFTSPAKYRDLCPAFPQVSELSSALEGSFLTASERELADLLEHRDVRNRHVLDEAGERRRKYEIETGILRDGKIGSPLEPWTAPGSRWSSMYLYGRIMHAEPGAYNLADFDDNGIRLDQVQWMARERLITFDESMNILPLSDSVSPGRRAYPGAPVKDREASIGRYLRDKAAGLVAAALFNHSHGRLRRRSARRAQFTGDGMRVTVALICAEANRLKSRRPDLDEYRYLSVTRCAEIIRALIDGGLLEEIEPVRFTRRERSWRTIVRVVRRLDDEIDEAAAIAAVEAWDAAKAAERRARKAHTALELAA